MGLLELFLAAGAYNHMEDRLKKVHSQDTVTKADVAFVDLKT